ncbi:hypothetical protein [Rathayibacter toxicus]|uniref:DNA/RNA endonuclease G n=1 Tax=Rathayibacter toxicus TaxID=145458 RepID=A0A0C5B8K9_9MICO|nr:hypothetical protein [Rathayibacter toxicus]AJM77123.1 hypothetical protein TI83_02410 [Rathayibacter toxicus]ALS57044.1 hypothetical protein APU90_04065 [Rathayibacter toxicus]KKM46131.1 hypothetical protein VT73_03425 [Rathayibacter toxicus]PPG23082.1 hypothetical protein C5D15_02200 [Rathayibacter toxicus]PPG47665.1 hypothetical protein C5D16_02195 [Rathayibacter toxicus]
MSPTAQVPSAVLDARYRRYRRRETHHSRSAAQIIVLVLIALGAAYLGTETMLTVLSAPPLIATPATIVSQVLEISMLDSWALVGIAVGTGVLALILLTLALGPGTRARRIMSDERLAVVVDDGVIASSLARTARTAAHSRREDTRSSIGRRTALVEVIPSSGIAVDRDHVQAAVNDELARIAPLPTPRASVRIADMGRI